MKPVDARGILEAENILPVTTLERLVGKWASHSLSRLSHRGDGKVHCLVRDGVVPVRCFALLLVPRHPGSDLRFAISPFHVMTHAQPENATASEKTPWDASRAEPRLAPNHLSVSATEPGGWNIAVEISTVEKLPLEEQGSEALQWLLHLLRIGALNLLHVERFQAHVSQQIQEQAKTCVALLTEACDALEPPLSHLSERVRAFRGNLDAWERSQGDSGCAGDLATLEQKIEVMQRHVREVRSQTES